MIDNWAFFIFGKDQLLVFMYFRSNWSMPQFMIYEIGNGTVLNGFFIAYCILSTSEKVKASTKFLVYFKIKS